MDRTCKTILLTTFLALSGLATSAKADSTEPDVTYFHGDWDCTGFMKDIYSGERFDVVGTWRFHPWANGWVTDTFETFASNGTHYSEWGWSHFDKNGNVFERSIANSMGGHGKYGTRGWIDDTWIWAGEVQGLEPYAMPTVQTITRKHDEHFWITVRFFDRQQQRRDLYKADCRRKGTQQRFDEVNDD